MKYFFRNGLIFTVVFAMVYPLMGSANELAPPLPNDSGQWLDQQPKSWSDLKGNVVLMNVWTFGCWNSYRSLPWIVSLQRKFPQLELIGIHSPEFDYEKNRAKLRETMKSYAVEYAQVLDDDHQYWKKLGNQYWPAFYLVDKQGKIRFRFAGETHEGDPQSRQIEKQIQLLLKES